jgi:hypothetical protein
MFLGCVPTSSSSKVDFSEQVTTDWYVLWPAVLKSGHNSQIRATARADALADIAKGQPRICCVGTVATFPIGVPDKYLDEAWKLPEVPLPNGCTLPEPLLNVASVYAKAYNAEIVRYLKSKQN